MGRRQWMKNSWLLTNLYWLSISLFVKLDWKEFAWQPSFWRTGSSNNLLATECFVPFWSRRERPFANGIGWHSVGLGLIVCYIDVHPNAFYESYWIEQPLCIIVTEHGCQHENTNQVTRPGSDTIPSHFLLGHVRAQKKNSSGCPWLSLLIDWLLHTHARTHMDVRTQTPSAIRCVGSSSLLLKAARVPSRAASLCKLPQHKAKLMMKAPGGMDNLGCSLYSCWRSVADDQDTFSFVIWGAGEKMMLWQGIGMAVWSPCRGEEKTTTGNHAFTEVLLYTGTRHQ